MMLEFLQGVIIVFIEMFCLTLFVDSIYASLCNNNNLSKMLRIVLLTFFSILFSYFFDAVVVLKVIAVVVSSAVILTIFNRKNPLKNIAITIVFMGIELLVDYIALVVYAELVIDYLDYLRFIQPIVVILSKTVLFLVILIINRVVDRNSFILLKDNEWLKFLFFPVFTIVLTIVFIYNSELVVSNGLEFLLWIVACGLVGIDIIVFCFIVDIAKKEQTINEIKILNVQAKNQLSYYEKIKEDLELQRLLSHEYNNQLECINSLLDIDSIDELKMYVSKVSNSIKLDTDYIDSNNSIVNAIVNTKYHEALTKGITIMFYINDLSKLNISSEDLVVLLANTLNNAIEACSNCDKKMIKLKLSLFNGEFIISVKNSFSGVIKCDKGELLTTKLDHKNHGYGMKNITRVISKNNGDYVIHYSENEFYISIIIPQ